MYYGFHVNLVDGCRNRIQYRDDFFYIIDTKSSFSHFSPQEEHLEDDTPKSVVLCIIISSIPYFFIIFR